MTRRMYDSPALTGGEPVNIRPHVYDDSAAAAGLATDLCGRSFVYYATCVHDRLPRCIILIRLGVNAESVGKTHEATLDVYPIDDAS